MLQADDITSCPNCKDLQQQLASVQKLNKFLRLRVAELEARNKALISRAHALETKLRLEQALRAGAEGRIKQLEERVGANPTNSHVPPSAKAPGSPPVTVKKPTGRKRGAQLGHPGHYRKLVPEDKVDKVVKYQPQACAKCQADLSGLSGKLIGRHQVAELPPIAVEITEHQSWSCRCENCGTINRGEIPEAARASAIGERLSAAIGLLSAQVHGSRRAIAAAVQEMLGCPIALGTISAREHELSTALAAPYQQLVDEVAASDVKYVDETGWSNKGEPEWLFTAATESGVIFLIDRDHTRPAFERLLGGTLTGTFCTDRAGIYDILPGGRRGLCWAHLKRDFKRCLERGGPSEAIGTEGTAICKFVFDAWHEFRDGKLTRDQLQKRIRPIKKRMVTLLRAGIATGILKTKGLCKHLLKRRKSLWLFATVPGLEPTNNLAERMLRPAVIWRKMSFGSDSKRGCRYVSRMMSIIQTLRLRGGSALDYLSSALKAHRQGANAPPIPPPTSN